MRLAPERIWYTSKGLCVQTTPNSSCPELTCSSTEWHGDDDPWQQLVRCQGVQGFKSQ